MTAILLAALLSLVPHTARTRCVEAHAAQIAEVIDTLEEGYGVRPSVLLVVGFRESMFGCDPRSGGSWGSPRDRRHRHISGGPEAAARDLTSAYRVCGDWVRALRRYRCGTCWCRPRVGYLPEDAWRMAQRIESLTRAGR